MGVLDDVFAGDSGVANMLLDVLGGSAIVETEVGETYDELTDRTVKDIRRQVLPMAITDMSDENSASVVPNGDNGGLTRNETLFMGIVPTTRLTTEPKPLKTIVRQGRNRYQAVKVEPTVVGDKTVIYRLTMRKL